MYLDIMRKVYIYAFHLKQGGLIQPHNEIYYMHIYNIISISLSCIQLTLL